MLDLPSSDLDVVVCGLDHIEAAMTVSPTPQKSMANFNGIPEDKGTPEIGAAEADTQLAHHQVLPPYVALHLNAERVVRLAAELERQPWAVHVKAIPTASVPVVKVLADPSRLPGATNPSSEGNEWEMPNVPASGSPPTNAPPASGPQVPHYDPSISTPVWRGADVINGLLSLDITFEGPEHGGIGSTEFSAHVVQEVCNETGLVAESTPFVQVIMVVKELLAQRRLNEPFSGGLSSYALLLLVLAVVCERKVIREELDRVERQRIVVAAGGGNSGLDEAPPEKPSTTKKTDQTGTQNRPPTASAGATGKSKTAPIESPGGATATETISQATRAAQKPNAQAQKRTQANSQHEGHGATQGAAEAGQSDNAKGNNSDRNRAQRSGKKPGNSWACIAKGNKSGSQQGKKEGSPSQQKKAQQTKKPSSFADAVARNASAPAQAKPPATKASNAPQPPASRSKPVNTSQTNKSAEAGDPKKRNKKQPAPSSSAKNDQAAKNESAKNPPALSKAAEKGLSADLSKQDTSSSVNEGSPQHENGRKIEADEETSKFNNYSSVPVDPGLSANQSVFPQGFNDVIEVLCSGETTPGKLLMHFLLFYGQHFDAHATAIDISGKHHRDIVMQNPPYTHLSPYIQRRTAGTIDPITGMLTVDPIVVYDPLEGAENNNVARRCFLWSSVKWVFAQSYMTLSSAVERNATPPATPVAGAKNSAGGPSGTMSSTGSAETENAAWSGPYNPTDRGNLFDPSSPLLELLLSF
jgi:hypothetical protein